jgi:hypothetical protein
VRGVRRRMERDMGFGMLRAKGHRLRREMREMLEPELRRLKPRWLGHTKLDAKLHRLARARLRSTDRVTGQRLGQEMRHGRPWRGYTEEKAEVRRQKPEEGMCVEGSG